jgi:hypothetical protein
LTYELQEVVPEACDDGESGGEAWQEDLVQIFGLGMEQNPIEKIKAFKDAKLPSQQLLLVHGGIRQAVEERLSVLRQLFRVAALGDSTFVEQQHSIAVHDSALTTPYCLSFLTNG